METSKNELEKQVVVAEGPALLELYDGGVAHIRMNRPESANGLDREMFLALHHIAQSVHADKRVRAVLISGAGKNFCAGGDVHAFHSMGADLPYYIREATSYLQIVAGLLMRLNAPVVAAVQGYAAGGGGLGLVCSSDLVVAGESAKFLAGATRVAMVPDAGVSVTLTQIVGFRKAMEILMLNPTISAQEALQMGLINRVVPDAQVWEQGMALAQKLAQGAPLAQAATKRLLYSGLGRSVEAAMPDENQTQAQLCGSSDALEGLKAVIEKRAPKFSGR